jgi:hypothetical protein
MCNIDVVADYNGPKSPYSSRIREDIEARIVIGDETWIYYWEPESKRATGSGSIRQVRI